MSSSSRRSKLTGAKAGVAPGTSRERMRKVSGDLRKEKRSLLTKRHRGLCDGKCAEDNVFNEVFEDGVLEKAIVDLRTLKNKESLNILRRALCSSNPPIDLVISGGLINLLIEILRTSTVEQLTSDAVWCLTNIATGDHDQTGAVLAAVPELLAIIAGENSTLREQACWTIGNIAGDSDEHRTVLLANGALLPMCDFLGASLRAAATVPLADSLVPTATPEVTSANSSYAQTAAWALSNLVRGSTPAGAFLESGAMPFLLSVLKHHDLAVATEVWWVFSFLSAKEDESVQKLIENGLLDALESKLGSLDPAAMTSIPVLRTLGNLVTGPPHWIDMILSRSSIIASLLRIMANPLVSEKAVMKEAMYALGSILGGDKPHRISALQAGSLLSVQTFLTSDIFELQKEAVFALHNAGQEAECLHLLVSPTAAPIRTTLINLIRVPDHDLALACIQILKAVAFADPNEKKTLIEEYLSYEMYDALEHLLYVGGTCALLSAAARQAIDELFEAEEDDEVDQGGNSDNVFMFD
jgi:importin subunit alpha-6/7